MQYMSVSSFKNFKKCEAMALAELKGEYERPKSKALLLGSFVDEMLTGTKESQTQFIVENRSEIFQKSSKLSKCTDEELAVITIVFVTPYRLYFTILNCLVSWCKGRNCF